MTVDQSAKTEPHPAKCSFLYFSPCKHLTVALKIHLSSIAAELLICSSASHFLILTAVADGINLLRKVVSPGAAG